jgi:ribokinase
MGQVRRSGRVIVLGSVNRDLVLLVDHHPQPGETIAARGFAEHPGGKGANQAIAAARAGAKTLLAGAIGDDGFGRAMAGFLGGEAIDLSHLAMLKGHPTGIATIAVDKAGENIIIVSQGANALPGAEQAAAIAFGPGDHVIAQFEVPEAFILEGFARAKRAGAVTILNPAPMRALTQALMQLVDLLVLNETELAAATGRADISGNTKTLDAARSLRSRRDQAIIVTLGARGCIALAPGGPVRVPAQLVVPVDTTGAGDCFVGVLAAGLVEGISLAPALERASRAAAISVTRPGAASSIPRRAEYV